MFGVLVVEMVLPLEDLVVEEPVVLVKENILLVREQHTNMLSELVMAIQVVQDNHQMEILLMVVDIVVYLLQVFLKQMPS
tara:strand:- start:361 stop:600 length:240 start_codon:yes stop_codon:yes gene_type:complete